MNKPRMPDTLCGVIDSIENFIAILWAAHLRRRLLINLPKMYSKEYICDGDVESRDAQQIQISKR